MCLLIAFLLLKLAPQSGQVYCNPDTWTSMCYLVWFFWDNFPQYKHFQACPCFFIFVMAGLYLSGKSLKYVSIWMFMKAISLNYFLQKLHKNLSLVLFVIEFLIRTSKTVRSLWSWSQCFFMVCIELVTSHSSIQLSKLVACLILVFLTYALYLSS